jgi:hypothetical protein
MKDVLRWARTQWDRVAAAALAVAGAVALLIGWLGVSDAVYPAAQIPYVVSGGLVGIFLVGVGGVLWLSADLRDEWRELHRIQEQLAARPWEAPVDPQDTNGNGGAPAQAPKRRRSRSRSSA